MKSPILYISLFILSVTEIVAQQTNESVLAEGDWYKVGVLNNGAFKIDRSLLQSLNINPDQVSVDQLAVFGNSYNGMLPQANDDFRPDDLQEIATHRVGLSDGSFDADDYMLFFGKSSDHLSFNEETRLFDYHKNLYSDTSFYFITLKSSPGLVMESLTDSEVSGSNANNYLWHQAHELDINNLLNTGRHWLGERVTQANTSTSISFSGQGIVSGSDIQVFCQLLSTGTANSSFRLSMSGLNLGTVDLDAVSEEPYQTRADIKADTFSIGSSQIGSNDELEVRFDFEPGGVADGYVDYVHMVSRRRLDASLGLLHFFKESDVHNYSISGLNNGLVWDISNPTQPRIIASQQDGTISFGTSADAMEFMAINYDDVGSPIAKGEVQNQNLHGLEAVQVLYITHRAFKTATQTLANFRSTNDGLSTAVVTVQQIYNEYSSGRQDISAIRDFIKHQYDKYGQLQYVTLVGDCSFDYKDREIVQTNYVPIYESRNSVHEIESYSSDDFFGFLEDHEGFWGEDIQGDHTMEIGVGRIPIQTREQADLYISKLIRYESHPNRFGNWRNKIAFIADDGDGNIHQNDAEDLGQIVTDNQGVFSIEKIYLDEFDQVNLPSGQVSPQAREKFVNALSNGNLIVNYTGHGNIGQLMDEKVFEDELVDDLSNRHLMPFFVTATCEFGNYDNPLWVSGGEKILLHNNGGAIALLCSARPVYSNTNFLLNEAFYQAAMTKTDGRFQRLGDIMKQTKNTSLAGTRNRNYALLGDASMRLGFPDEQIRLTKINESQVDELDTLQALGRYVVEGEILNQSGQRDTDFDGTTVISIYDKPSAFRTKGDESPAQVFDRQDVLLFQGEVSVNAGSFSSEFIVPININYSYAPGKISFYGVDDTDEIDAHGANTSVIVGGSSDEFDNDGTPPEIVIYLGDTEFTSGSLIGANSTLLVHLSDEHGINTSKLGFGSDLKYWLDDNEPIIVNDFYTAVMNSFQEGWVTYPLFNLSKGEHSIKFEAFDVYNNRNEATVTFTVTDRLPLNITQLRNYPNPMVSQTTFTFSHDREGENLTADLVIMNFQGQVVYSQEYKLLDSPQQINNIVWDGRDAHGNRLNKGTYIYKLFVQSELDGAKTSKFQKLIILN